MGGLVMKWLGLAPKAAEIQPLRRPEQATLPVMRVMTMPGGEQIRVMREDAARVPNRAAALSVTAPSSRRRWTGRCR